MAEPGAGPDGSLNQDDARRFRAHPHAELTPGPPEALAGQLIEKREQLVVNLEALRRQIVAKEGCSLSDAADAAAVRAEAGPARGIAEQHRHTVAEIDAALERLRDGRYGVCERSGEAIPHERLRLVPWARECALE